MNDVTHCPRCDCELPAGTSAEMCPACLLEAGLTDDSSGSPAGDVQDRSAANAGRDAALSPTTPYRGGFIAPDAAELAPLFPQLELLGLLGQGGMGAVYQARQKKLDRLVALKIIRPESADDPAFAERFTREARTLARLNHQNIVAVHDFGEVESDGESVQPLYYFVMEYVDGANLRQLIESGQLSPEQALAIVPQICEALQYAHDEGVVHRDIKPENILVDSKGRVRIADFGLAKLAARSPEDFTLTATHQVMGTPRYMAPEQMGGSRHVDHRADIYSLGVVLYEMLTGEVPMGQFSPPSQKVAVDARLDEVVMRALAQEPDRRFQQASELKSSVDHISSSAMVARPYGQLPAGPSTIMERELVGAWRWVAGAQTSPQQSVQAQPFLLTLLLTIAGSLMLLLPWCDVEVAGPDVDDQHQAAQEAPSSVAAVIDRGAAPAAASFLPSLPVQRRQAVSVVRSASFPLLAQDAWPGTDAPVRTQSRLTHTFNGIDLVSACFSCVVFAAMTLMLISFPDSARRSMPWNLAMGLLAVTALISTLASNGEIENGVIRIPVDEIAFSNQSDANNRADSDSTLLCYWQDNSGGFWPGRGRSSNDGRTQSVIVRNLEHTLRYRAGFIGSIGLSLAALVLAATGVRNAISQREFGTDRRAGSSVQAQGSRSPDHEALSRLRTEVRLDVSAPSLTLLTTGSLTFLGHAAAFMASINLPFDRENSVLAAPGIVVGILMVVSGLSLRNLSSRGWAQLGAIAGMVPISAGWLLTLPTGIWALIVMRKEHVRDAFLEVERMRDHVT